MPWCHYCNKDFASTAALGSHIRYKHSDAEVEKKAPRASQDTHCPVCNYEQPFTSCWEDEGMTVCIKCLSMFDKHTKEVYSERGAKLRELGELPPIAR